MPQLARKSGDTSPSPWLVKFAAHWPITSKWASYSIAVAQTGPVLSASPTQESTSEKNPAGKRVQDHRRSLLLPSSSLLKIPCRTSLLGVRIREAPRDGFLALNVQCCRLLINSFGVFRCLLCHQSRNFLFGLKLFGTGRLHLLVSLDRFLQEFQMCLLRLSYCLSRFAPSRFSVFSILHGKGV